MELIQDILGWILLLAGGFFYFVGGVGLLRMPDVFTRMHAVSVSETMGVGLLILGMIVQAGFTLVAVKLIMIFLILMVVSPVSSHALARATLHDGEMPLLANAKNWITRADLTELFPELTRRIREPLMSEQVESDDPADNPLTRPPGYGYAYEGQMSKREGTD